MDPNIKIMYDSQGSTNRDVAQSIVKKWRDSDPIKDMVEADNYYRIKNTAIENKSRSYMGTFETEDGSYKKRVENETLSNVKIKSAFLRMSVDQKINYCFSKPFIFSTENEKYQEIWDEFLNEDNKDTIRRIAKDAVNKGIGWGHVLIGEDSKLTIQDIEPETLYPAWADYPHKKLDAIVRDYEVEEITHEGETIKRFVEFWDTEAMELFEDKGGILEPVPDTMVGHYGIKNGEEVESKGWGRVPFVALKSTDDEMPLLNIVKTYIDAYDFLNSKSVDGLIDSIDSVLVVKDVSAELRYLQDIREAVTSSRIVSVSDAGGAEYLKDVPDITAMSAKLDELYKDIMQFSSSIDIEDISSGSNDSGMAMKCKFQNLDIYCNGLESNFRKTMKDIKFYVDEMAKIQGKGDFTNEPITFSLDRDMLINITEFIDNVLNMSAEVSQETRDHWNPMVTDHATEQERRDKERKAMGDLAVDFNKEEEV